MIRSSSKVARSVLGITSKSRIYAIARPASSFLTQSTNTQRSNLSYVASTSTPFAKHSAHRNFATIADATPQQQADADPLLFKPRHIENVDVCIVGGGPAGLAAAIKLKQLDHEKGSGDMRVVVLEKAPEMGAQTISGAVIEPRALDELFGGRDKWIKSPPEGLTPVEAETFQYLTAKGSKFTLPEPPQMRNIGKNYIVSLNLMVKWLAEKAEELGVEVYPGFSVSEVIYDNGFENPYNKIGTGAVRGVATNDVGVSKDFKPKSNFERGLEFHAKVTLFAEGCHGSLTKQVIKKFNLRKDSDPQTYAIGIKEVWEVPENAFQKGFAAHTMGYPLSYNTYGGGFMYHFGDRLVSVGLVVGLDYKNPFLSPFQEFQNLKRHPFYKNVLENGKCVSYGARALNEGGFQSIPKLAFPGGALIGCSAGFLNVAKIKGVHTAMKSAMIAADCAYGAIQEESRIHQAEQAEAEESENPNADQLYAENYYEPLTLHRYERDIKDSWVWKELNEVRNVRPSFNSMLGVYGGIAWSGLDTMILKGRVPFTFHHKTTDAADTEYAEKYSPIEYPKPDGKLTFDLATSVSRSGTNQKEDEPCHLRVPDQDLNKHAKKSYPKYKGIESRFCPAGVYEYVEDTTLPDGVRFVINAQNCVHCKTCDIKDPTQDIKWTTPEGGDGPKYYMT